MKKPSLYFRHLENFNWPLLGCLLVLLAAGLVNLFSTSGGWPRAFNSFGKQAAFAAAGFLVLVLSLFFDYKILKYAAWPVYGVSILLVIAVRFWGVSVNGSTRWLALGHDAFRFQPSEFMKIALVVALAAHFSGRDSRGELGVRDLLFPLAVVGLPFAIILKQPDMGTALHLLLSSVPVFLIRRVRLWVIATLLTAGLTCGSWLFFFGGVDYLLKHEVIKTYHVARYQTFLDPESDPNDKGWQITQSKSAIGSGQLFGRGYMEGTQQKNGFLPASETDFAFSALAEEWGFAGAAATLAFYFALIWFSLKGVGRSGDLFGSLLSVGIAGLLFFQVAINVGMVTGLLPVVGIPLPFVSYGGTSTLMNIMCVALVLNVCMRRFKFMETPVKQNPAVWESPAAIDLGEASAVGVRRLTPHDPKEPDHHPAHRLPHIRPWLKHFGPKPWQLPSNVGG
ncbi:MAG: rod shape-determining protein RodA [Deltaproteobacteria bacterium]|nr:rod shape-determining protein RodA [Deltaproteobacteria bacterium]